MADDNDTAPVTGRDVQTNEGSAFAPLNCESGDRSAFEPDKAWLDAFQKQLTATLLDRVRKFARRRARHVAKSGHKVDDYYERELVHDAVTDTWTGVLRWDPERCLLEKHIANAIKTRTNKLHNRGVRLPHISLGDRTGSSRRAERDASAAVADPDRVTNRIYAREVVARIRAAAAGDKDVLRILDAYEAGAQTRDDVRVVTRMRERTYHNAHIRLMRIVRNAVDCTLAPKARA